MGRKESIKKEIFLDDLPRKEGVGALKGQLVIDWIRSVGYRVRFIYDGIEGIIEIVSYDGKYLYIKYLDKEPFKIHTGSFTRCKIGKLLDKRTNKFKIELGTIFKDNKRDIIIIDREYRLDKSNTNRKWYKYKCNKCGWTEGWIIEGHLFIGNGCPVCCQSPTLLIEGINDLATTNPWMVKFFANPEDAKLYTSQSNKKVKVKCPDCGRAKDGKTSIDNIYKHKSISCICGDGFSYGHKYVYGMLKQLGIKFKDNHKFDWCKFYNPYKERQTVGEYDFVIEDLKLIVEVDGEFHRNDNKMNGQKKEESIYLDNMKNKLAEEYGYKDIIRVSDENSIKDNILKSELNDLFDLSQIDWVRCEEFALSNRVKEVCELKRDNPDISTIYLGEIMNLDRSTIIKYLKMGNKLGWCEYDSREEMKKTYINNGIRSKKICSRLIEVFKDGISLGIFESGTELARQSKELFGVKLLQSEISAVAIGKANHHKGFIFKYI